jgi:hypothetical protein
MGFLPLRPSMRSNVVVRISPAGKLGSSDCFCTNPSAAAANA